MSSFYEKARAGAADQYGRAHVDRFARQARFGLAVRWGLIMVGLVVLAFTAGVHWQ